MMENGITVLQLPINIRAKYNKWSKNFDERLHYRCGFFMAGKFNVTPARHKPNWRIKWSILPGPFLLSYSVFGFIFPYFSFLCRALD